MNDIFKRSLTGMFDERMSDIINELRKNLRFYGLERDIQNIEEHLKEKLDKDEWITVIGLVRKYKQVCYIQSKYLYTQGALDCAKVLVYLDGELIEHDFEQEYEEDEY